MRSLFINDQDQLRSGWRVAAFLAAFVFFAAILAVIVQTILAALDIHLETRPVPYLVTHSFASLILAILLGWLFGKFLENLPFRALGAAFTNRWLLNLIAGLIVGSLTIGIAVFAAYALGGLRFEWNREQTSTILNSLMVSLAVFGVAAAFEEALFRGYILQTLARAGYAWLAISLTSVVFGAVHLANPDASLVSTLNTILAGVWFSLAYLKTRDLWFVWGLHLTWNWVQGSVFGIEVSGLRTISAYPILNEVDSGPTWLTGETYGIEGGLACTIALALSMVFIHYLPFMEPDKEIATMSEPPA